MFPADGHVHSEWSWDTTNGSMERTCERAVELGLPAVAFTEHADSGGWAVLASDLDEYPHLRAFVTEDRVPGDPVGGTLRPPRLDVDGYLACLHRCRDRFPDLRILSGIELGEPHRDREAVARLLEVGRFDRILGSLHSLPDGKGFSEMPNLFRQRRPADVIRDYLVELVRLIEGSDAFVVLGHIDYALRYWPESAGPFEVGAFEGEFRHALRVLGSTGRTLEVNTRGQLPPEIVRWWREEGGDAVSFGSDAHDPTGLARGFAAATVMVEEAGFRPGRLPHDVWRRLR
jgi:histidinol-phosphatase (PHP family)